MWFILKQIDWTTYSYLSFVSATAGFEESKYVVLPASPILANSLLYLLNSTVVNACLAGTIHFGGYFNCWINVLYIENR